MLNDRILVKNQTTQTQNGIYYVSTAGTTGVATVLTRATDYDNHVAGQAIGGDFVFVAVGTVNGTTGWVENATGTSTNPINGIKIGTDNITFTQFSGAGTYTASNGITLTGNNFTFNPLSTGGLQTASGGASILLATNSGLSTSSSGLTFTPTSTGGLTTGASGAYILLATNSGLSTSSSGLQVNAGTGLTVSGSTISVSSTTPQKYSTTNPSLTASGGSVTWTVTHSLGTQAVLVQVYDSSANTPIEVDFTRTSTSVVTLTWASTSNVTAGAYTVVVIG
mgnify:CR=1 FL=1